MNLQVGFRVSGFFGGSEVQMDSGVESFGSRQF